MLNSQRRERHARNCATLVAMRESCGDLDDTTATRVRAFARMVLDNNPNPTDMWWSGRRTDEFARLVRVLWGAAYRWEADASSVADVSRAHTEWRPVSESVRRKGDDVAGPSSMMHEGLEWRQRVVDVEAYSVLLRPVADDSPAARAALAVLAALGQSHPDPERHIGGPDWRETAEVACADLRSTLRSL